MMVLIISPALIGTTAVCCEIKQMKLLVSTRRVFGFRSTHLLNAFVSLLVANKERSGREEVCSLSMQLSADLQSHIAEDRLCQALLVRKSRFFFFSRSNPD